MSSSVTMTEPVAKPKFNLGRWLWCRLIGRSTKPTTVPRDSIREGLETIVFVVVLVFMLKQFVVEAFVIPTGSMAETLYGYRMDIHCPECGYDFQLNASCEVDPSDGRPRPVEGYCCPNCRYKQSLPRTPLGSNAISGDRVLVLKAIYHREKAVPGDVVVFKYPEKPQINYSATNYIKRMWATGGQTLAIYRGDLYVCDSLVYTPADHDGRGEPCELPEDANDLWKIRYTYHNADNATKLFEESRAAGFPETGKGFRLIRKNDVLLREMQRIVYDNDHQAAALEKKGVPPRWRPETSDWAGSDGNQKFAHTGTSLGWLRYRNLIVDDWRAVSSSDKKDTHASVVDNFLGYNGETEMDGAGNWVFKLDRGSEDSRYWVGDLIVECDVDFGAGSAEVVLELSKGPNRFQAILANSEVTIRRTGPEGKDLATATTPSLSGQHKLKFANVDCRLRVWVDGKAIPFEKPVDYAPLLPTKFDPADTKKEGWVTANDIDAPVSIGAKGEVTVSKLKIYRDTYYIPVHEQYRTARHISSTVSTHFAQPGHYFCLGDNSAQSSDSRVWGTVPDRLLLGKAVCIFFPIGRIGLIK